MLGLNPVDINSFKMIVHGASKRQITILAITILLTTLTTVGTPVAFGLLIEGLTSGSIYFPAILFALYAVVIGAARLISDFSFRLVELIELDVIHHAGIKLFESVLRKKASFSLRYSSGYIIDAVRNMQDSYGIYVFLAFSTLLPSIFETIVAAFVVSLVINWQIGILVVIYSFIIITLTYISNERAKVKYRNSLTALSDSADILGEAMGSFQVIKAAQGGNWLSGLYRTKRADARRSRQEYHKVRLQFAFARSFTFTVQLALMYVISIHFFQQGTLSIAQLIIFNGLILQLNRPSELIAGALEDLLSARQLQEGYNTIIEYPEFLLSPENISSPTLNADIKSENAVVFSKVSFAYENCQKLLNDLDIKFSNGKINFITGPSGVGKTTLLRLILRFVEGYDGDIYILGRNLASYSEQELFALVGYVPQSPDILAASFADNIKLGSPISDNLINVALQKVGLDKLVERLPEGLQTKIGRGGISLSGGEMQRLAIARAILQNPKILVLDEPSSALDIDIEKNIFSHLRLLSDDLTIIAITHRTHVIGPEDFVADFDRLKIS